MTQPGFDLLAPDTGISCAHCGAPLHTLRSYAVSVPLNSQHRPADLCDLNCLAAWATANGARRQS